MLYLKPLLKNAKVPDITNFTVNQWLNEKKSILLNLKSQSLIELWIVRSSAASEDQDGYSNAGKYTTIQNVLPDKLSEAVEIVINSYENNFVGNEVLIQPMVKNILRSGVAFTHDPNTNSPYRVINFSEGRDSTIVTAGFGGETWQNSAKTRFPVDRRIAVLMPLISELTTIFEGIPLDIEFAISEENSATVLWLLQVRPLILSDSPESENEQEARLQVIEESLRTQMLAHPFLLGKRTAFGVMPDWNPAEIIGTRPNPLSLSLYKEMITDSIWAYQRNNYGYMNLRSFPLLINFFGLPYIDVRVSFNSFIPATLNRDVANKLVDYYIEKLINYPEFHDKVEFEIVHSCYSLDLLEKLKPLRLQGFLNSEINEVAESLRQLTNKIINPHSGLWLDDAKKLKVLAKRRQQILENPSGLISKIYWLLEDGKRYGTLPFAGLARAAFIAVQMLKSLVSLGILDEEDYVNFMGNVSTVTGKLNKDKQELDKTTFLKLYGHLRPGTYDITSSRYDEDPDQYFNWNENHVLPAEKVEFNISTAKLKLIADCISSNKLESDPDTLLSFIKSTIELRELAKFEFSKNISEALVLITQFGKELGLNKKDLSFCDISVFKSGYGNAQNMQDSLIASIESGRQKYNQTMKTSLPPLIVNTENIWGFNLPKDSPNYIGQKSVIGDVAKNISAGEIKNKIVCIEKADPGFDWIFSHQIRGLVTAWGGVNSHMAIRAGELGLPAVIGAGESLYKKCLNSDRLNIDCANKRIAFF